MKRSIACLLLLAVLMMSAAAAESVSGEAFYIRNGITWGMSPDEVKTREDKKNDHIIEDGYYYGLGYENVPVSIFATSSLRYIFISDELAMISYDIPTQDEHGYIYLDGALTSKYTRNDAPDAEELYSVLDSFDQSRRLLPHSSEVCKLVMYTCEDTHIYLFRTDDDSYLAYLIYIHDSGLETITYNTDGI